MADAIDSLNHAFRHDPHAMHALMSNRVPTNAALANESMLVVDTAPIALPPDAEDHEVFYLGALGMLNGILEVLTGYRAAIRWTEANPPIFDGFCLFVPPSVGMSFRASPAPWVEQDIMMARWSYERVGLYTPVPEFDCTGILERLQKAIRDGHYETFARHTVTDTLFKFIYEEAAAWFDGSEDDNEENRGVFAATAFHACDEVIGKLLAEQGRSEEV